MTSTGVDVKECIQSKGYTIPVTTAEIKPSGLIKLPFKWPLSVIESIKKQDGVLKIYATAGGVSQS